MRRFIAGVGDYGKIIKMAKKVCQKNNLKHKINPWKMHSVEMWQ